MEKRIQKLIETPNGNGEIYKDGKRLASVYYSLVVKQEYLVRETLLGKEEIPGNMVINGMVAITGKDREQIGVIQAMTSGGALSLILKDGRYWESISPNGEPEKGTFLLISRRSNGLVSGPSG